MGSNADVHWHVDRRRTQRRAEDHDSARNRRRGLSAVSIGSESMAGGPKQPADKVDGKYGSGKRRGVRRSVQPHGLQKRRLTQARSDDRIAESKRRRTEANGDDVQYKPDGKVALPVFGGGILGDCVDHNGDTSREVGKDDEQGTSRGKDDERGSLVAREKGILRAGNSRGGFDARGMAWLVEAVEMQEIGKEESTSKYTLTHAHGSL